MKEKAILFGKNGSLVGIVTEPESHNNDHLPGIILLNAFLIHRVGPRRLYVKMARQLARNGHTVLRFDFSGIGDSLVENDCSDSNERNLQEIREAMEWLRSRANVSKFILIGLCGGAHAAFRSACVDDHIAGVVLIDGFFFPSEGHNQLGSQVSNLYFKRVFKTRLFEWSAWQELLSNPQTYLSAIRYIINAARPRISEKPQSEKKPMQMVWQKLADRGIESFLIYSEGRSKAIDVYHAIHEKALNAIVGTYKPSVEIIPNTDHVFTPRWSQERLINLVCLWISDTWPRTQV